MRELWTEKYNPTTVAEYVFHDTTLERRISTIIKDKEFSHLLLSGIQGIGKTSLAKLIINSIKVDPSDILYVDGTKNNSVDYVRDVIINFASTFPIGAFKVVRLEEADYLSQNAQAALREVLVTQSDTCRFIMTCNYDNKIIPAIKSRVQHLHFKTPPKDDIIVRCGEILELEKIEFDIDLLTEYVTAAYPDIRKTIQFLFDNIVDGKLVKAVVAVAADYHFQLLDLLVAGELKGIRKLICENVAREEYDGVYRFLYENIHLAIKDAAREEHAIVIIAKYAHMNGFVADPEINFAGCAIELTKL